MKKLNLSIIVFILPFMLAAQTNVDSLENVLETQKLTAEEEIKIHKQLANSYRDSNPEKLAFHARKVLDYAIKSKDELPAGLAYNFIGLSFQHNLVYDSALIYYQKAVDIAIKINDMTLEANMYISLSALYVKQSDNIKGLEYCMKALSLAESTNNLQQQVSIMCNMGGIYQLLNDLSHAQEYFEKAEAIVKKNNLTDEEYAIYYHLANIYFNQRENLDKSLEYFLKGLELARATSFVEFEIACLQGIGQIYYLDEYKDYDKAEKYTNESIEIADSMHFPFYLIMAYGMLADIYRLQERYEKCDAAATKSWEMDTTNTRMGRDIIVNIVYANIMLGNKDKATQYLEKLIEVSRKVNEKSLHDSLTEMETKYDTEKKETRIATLEKTQKLYTGLIIAIALAALFAVLFLWQRLLRSRREKELTETRATTQGILEGEMKERERFATELHNGVQSALRKIRENLLESAAEVDSVIEEVQDISRGLMSKTLKMSGLSTALEDYCRGLPRVEFYFAGTEKRTSELLENFLYRSAQELVTNSLKHSEAQKIEVQLLQDKNHIYLTVSDDGKGYDTTQETAGIGVRNIRTRVEAFGGTMDVASSPGNGTETSITVKI
jgi:signal transduction histidine kinase